MNGVGKAELDKPLAHVNCMSRESGADDDRLGLLDVRGGVTVEVLRCEVCLPVVAAVRQGGGKVCRLRTVLLVVPRVETLNTILSRVGHAWTWGYEVRIRVRTRDKHGA